MYDAVSLGILTQWVMSVIMVSGRQSPSPGHYTSSTWQTGAEDGNGYIMDTEWLGFCTVMVAGDFLVVITSFSQNKCNFNVENCQQHEGPPLLLGVAHFTWLKLLHQKPGFISLLLRHRGKLLWQPAPRNPPINVSAGPYSVNTQPHAPDWCTSCISSLSLVSTLIISHLHPGFWNQQVVCIGAW